MSLRILRSSNVDPSNKLSYLLRLVNLLIKGKAVVKSMNAILQYVKMVGAMKNTNLD